MIPQAAPGKRFDTARAEIMRAIETVFDRGIFLLGPETEAFETEFAAAAGTRHAVGVGSGTDALALALRAAGLRPGDEVVTVSMTAVATAVAIEDAGGVPRFVDIDPKTRCMDPEALARAIGPRTTAVVPVHLHGFAAPMDAILAVAKPKGLIVIEDCAQAHGAAYRGRRVGTFGHAAACSFYPTKNLGAAGDAGAVATDDPAIAARVRRMRQYGWDDRRVATGPGSNRRIDELQAAILRVLLPHLDAQASERRLLATQYRQALAGCVPDLPPDDPGAVYHQFAPAVDRRDAVQAALKTLGVQTAIHYGVGIHEQPRYADAALSLPVTERLAGRLLSLPIQPEVARGRVDEICSAFIEGLKRCSRL
jgi:dTDP-3-amino-3,4,6-trideoxy-alpha-D-glucose transaminase